MAERRLFKVGILALAFVVTAGCGGGGVTVSGSVTFDGAPLDKGTLEFRTPNGAGVVAFAPINGGKYQVSTEANLQPGTYKVWINSPQKSGKQIPAGSPAPPGTMVDEIVEAIPSRYNEATELEKTVVAGANTFDFSLAK